MSSKKWGRHTWIMIFCSIYKYQHEIESLKKLIFLICDNLPCPQCRNHAIQNMTQNNIMSSTDINQILSFFIQLYNQFHNNQIILNNIRLL